MSVSDFNGELMKEVVARADLLATIDEEPRTLRELEKQLPLARSTIHRTTNTLIDNGILEKSDTTYELTGVGAILVDAIGEFESTVTGAERLEPFLNTIGPMDIEIPVHYFCDADVTQPGPHQAHVAINRIIELIENSNSLKMCSSIISPFYVEVAHREILDGMEITVIFNEQIIDTVVTEYQSEAIEALETTTEATDDRRWSLCAEEQHVREHVAKPVEEASNHCSTYRLRRGYTFTPRTP
jgi:predicted transcriptional regulator